MEINKNIVFGITGANGYLGSSIKNYLVQNSFKVIEYNHSLKKKDANVFQLTLNETIDPEIFKGVDILIHCAYDFKLAKWEDIYNINVLGSEKIFSDAKSSGIKKIIYISSMSAFEDCKSKYGKAKLMTEKSAIEQGCIVIRPGLIYGKNAGGMMGALNKILSIPIIPLMGMGKQKLYLIHQNDLNEYILYLSFSEEKYGKPIVAAYNKYKTFKEILKILALVKNKRRIFFPFPWQIFWFMLKFSEMLKIKIGFRSDSLISLVNQDPNPNFDTINKSKINLREFTVDSVTE